MKILDYMKDNILYLDGGMGTLLQERGLLPGEYPELWNITHPEFITDIQKGYYDVGSNVVLTNTFGANSLKFSQSDLKKIIENGIKITNNARKMSDGVQNKYVALDIGPIGKMLKPYGDFDFEDAVSVFANTVNIAKEFDIDLVFIETMSDSYETKAALLAVKENCDLPVFVSNAYGSDGKLMTGATPEVMVSIAEGLGADAVGANCSLGPAQLGGVIERLLKCSSVPVLIKPNAGLPKVSDGKTVYDITEDEFSDIVAQYIKDGVKIAGGCCGTTGIYIKKLKEKTKDFKPLPVSEKNISCISSYTHTVNFGEIPVLIGERINPTGKKRFKQALKENDLGYVLEEGINQQNCGADVLDVNVGLPEIDEKKVLKNTVFELQSVVDLPLQIDTSDPVAMEEALRIYNGKALINSVNGKEESMKAIFPLVKKYGGMVVALTLDENGIPSDADGRIEIAKKIIKTAEEYGIPKKDIIFDPLAMAVSADRYAAKVTLSTVERITEELSCLTSLGISNVSFGLPVRDAVNCGFFASALERGLSAAIMNPYSENMLKTYYSYCVLKGFDENCEKYIEFMSAHDGEKNSAIKKDDSKSSLKDAVINGLKEKAKEITKELVSDKDPIEIINTEVIPALDVVGKGFEDGTVYLPQLLMSAEAAKSSFYCIKELYAKKDKSMSVKCDFVIATVHGDIHDIGKNIVRLLLENYGFNVHDLGKDVPPGDIVECVIKYHSPLVGLSALMTTTVPSMEKTIKELKKHAPWCKVVVGGAVLTQEYADSIGADMYVKDAMETVRYAEKIYGEL